ncbi:hypothetical protein MARINON1_50833 [Marinobacter salarius]|nr:hypothetical protein MARINON1_50833 [Marinobacter salarius]
MRNGLLGTACFGDIRLGMNFLENVPDAVDKELVVVHDEYLHSNRLIWAIETEQKCSKYAGKYPYSVEISAYG